MAIKIDNNWPLMIVNPVKESTLQKEVTSHLPAKKLPDPGTPDNKPGRRTDISFEKGVFVDVYI